MLLLLCALIAYNLGGHYPTVSRANPPLIVAPESNDTLPRQDRVPRLIPYGAGCCGCMPDGSSWCRNRRCGRRREATGGVAGVSALASAGTPWCGSDQPARVEDPWQFRP